MNNIFLLLHFVSSTDKRAELYAQFMLAWCDFMVMLFDSQTHFFTNREHFATDISSAVNRLYGEVAALDTGAMADIAAFNILTGRVRGFDVL